MLAQVIREVRPQVVLGYEPGGGYGHPDHVHAHRVMMRAVELAAAGCPAVGLTGGLDSPDDVDAPWDVPKLYWTVQPESLVRAALEMMASAGARGLDPTGPLPSMVIPDGEVTTTIDATAFTPAKVAALRAHETQVAVTEDGSFFALSNGIQQPIVGLEFYRRARGAPAPPFETDLVAGLAGLS